MLTILTYPEFRRGGIGYLVSTLMLGRGDRLRITMRFLHGRRGRGACFRSYWRTDNSGISHILALR